MDIIFDSPEEEAAFASGDFDKWLALVEQEEPADESNAPAAEQAASDHQPEEKTSDEAGPVTPPTPSENLLRLIEIEQEQLHTMEV